MSSQELLLLILGISIGLIAGSGVTLLVLRAKRTPSEPVAEDSTAVTSRAMTPGSGGTASVPPIAQSTGAPDEITDFDLSPWRWRFRGKRSALLIVAVVVLLAVAAIIAGMYLRRQPPPPTTHIVVSPIIKVEVLQDQMRNTLVRPTYQMEPYPNNELVQGAVGSYYAIDLRSAALKRSLFFKPEEYDRDESTVEFRASMSAIREDILRHLEGHNIKYRLFVRGRADRTGNEAPYLGELRPPTPKQIEYYPRNPDDSNQYVQVSAAQTIPVRFANPHLPNLRATYITEKLRAVGFEASILDGDVAKTALDEDRSATLFLFVPWPSVASKPQNHVPNGTA
jgi:hypothetical protein